MFPIEFPIIQAGMVWTSGAKLASACANAGILGLIGAGSMKPDILEKELDLAFKSTTFPERIGVNVPLLYPLALDQINVALQKGIKIFFTSAGSPTKFTSYLKDKGATVVHVTSNPDLAIKCEKAKVDAIVAEGFEAGGHNGRDELTTLVLIPQVVDAVSIPVIAAGGILDGRGIKAMEALGASGVQLGSRFLMTQESSAHMNFKKKILESKCTDTDLVMKSLVPVRLLKNEFYHKIKEIEDSSLLLAEQNEKLKTTLGHGRAKRGIFEGDLIEGELEIGQGIGLLKNIPTVAECVKELLEGYQRLSQ